LKERHHNLLNGAPALAAADGGFDAAFDPIDGLLALMRPSIVPRRFNLLPAIAGGVHITHSADLVVVASGGAFGRIHTFIQWDDAVIVASGVKLHDTLSANHAAALTQTADQVALDQNGSTIVTRDKPHAGIFGRQTALHLVSRALNRAQHPIDL